jgi:hypothetical protein
LLIWLNVGWAILLFGAEYSYAHRSVSTYEYMPGYTNLSPYMQKLLALKILNLIAVRFAAGAPALDSAEISKKLELPTRATKRLLSLLEGCNLLTRSCRGEESERTTYHPASDIGSWTVAMAYDALEKGGAARMPLEQLEGLSGIAGVLEKLRATVESSPVNVLIKDIDA